MDEAELEAELRRLPWRKDKWQYEVEFVSLGSVPFEVEKTIREKGKIQIGARVYHCTPANLVRRYGRLGPTR